MFVHECHRPCPDGSGCVLSEEDKRRGLLYIRRIRQRLCNRQLCMLRAERKRLTYQLRRSTDGFKRVRLRIRLCALEKKVGKIKQRWL